MDVTTIPIHTRHKTNHTFRRISNSKREVLIRRIELKAHANVAFKAHSKAHEWAELTARLDRAEKASLPDMRRLSDLVLEMARDNQAETAYLHELEDNALLWIQLEKELEVEGTDLDTFFVSFRLTPTEKR